MRYKDDEVLASAGKRRVLIAGTCVLAAALVCALLAFGQTFVVHADDEQAAEVPTISLSDAVLHETAGYEKGEVVYSTLDARGNRIASYVVNQFDVKTPGRIVDYGEYQTVKNLSTKDELLRQDGATVFDVIEPGVFYYEGDSAELDLPWDVSIEYSLDGEQYRDPAELGGKSGALEIRLRTSQNHNVNSAFYESFLLQITFTLPGDLCADIEAPSATIASAGKDRSIAFTALPGHNADCVVRANVHDFEMGGIQIAALPYSSAISLPDTSSVTAGFQQLVDAVALLRGGAADLSAGTDQLARGTAQLSEGLGMLNTQEIQKYADGVASLIGFLPSIMQHIEISEESLHQTAQALNALADFLEVIKGLDDETMQRIIEQMEAAGITIDFNQAIEILHTVATTLGDNAADIVSLCKELSDPEKAAEIQEQIKLLSNGLLELKDGVLQLADGAGQLADGMQTYSDGMNELYGGVSQLPGRIESEISSMTAEFSFPEFVPQSFVSAENTQMKSVQFVIESAGIDAPKAKDDSADQEEKQEGFFDRLLALFIPKS